MHVSLYFNSHAKKDLLNTCTCQEPEHDARVPAYMSAGICTSACRMYRPACLLAWLPAWLPGWMDGWMDGWLAGRMDFIHNI